MPSEFPNRRTVLRLGGAALAGLSTAGCLSGRSSSGRTVTMTDDFGFDPKDATIETGQTVTWKNASDVGHTVTAYEGEIPNDAAYFASGDFDSERAARSRVGEGLVASGGEYKHAFEVPGTYEYYCIPHESSGMVGTIRVE